MHDIRLDKKLQNVSLCISTKLEERHHPGSINTESQDRFQELLEGSESLEILFSLRLLFFAEMFPQFVSGQ